MNLDAITDSINDHNRNLATKSPAIDSLIEIGEYMAGHITANLGDCEIVSMWREAVAKVRQEVGNEPC